MRVERVTVGPNRVEALLRADADEPGRTSAYPDLPRTALGLLPGLAMHPCENESGRRFVAELADTEIAHLFEHVALECMVLAGSPRTLAGETSWDFARDGRGVFRVILAYDDDLVALGALRLAEAVVAHLTSGAPAPDVVAETARLQGLRTG